MKILSKLDSLDNIQDGNTRKLITKATSSGSGNAVTAVSVSGDTITYTKGSTFLTGHQSAFSNVKVGSSTVAADQAGDTLELVAGSNITLTPDTTNDKVTIAATVPTKTSQLTNDSGYTTNTGTITGIKMNGASKGTSGVVDLGTVITAHQDISGKYNKSGGAITGAITRSLASSGTIATTNLFSVSGSTDGFKVDYAAATADKGVTTLYTTDDADAKISIGNTVSSTYKEAISIANGSATINGYVPAAASAKSVDTSITAASTSANLPTSAAVATFVEGKGYTTNTGTVTGVSVNGTSIATSGVANITSVPASILSGAIANGVTATTQSSGDNSTKVATTAYVDVKPTILSGTSNPASNLGKNGDIYIKIAS